MLWAVVDSRGAVFNQLSSRAGLLAAPVSSRASGVPDQMKCATIGGSVFLLVSLVVVTAWTAVDIWVFGRFEEKWGSPLDNLIFGFQLSAVAFALAAFGCFFSVFVLGRWLHGWKMKECLLIGAFAAAAGFVLLAAGLFPWFEDAVPLLEGVADMAVAFVLTGALAGVAGIATLSVVNRCRRGRPTSR